MTALPVTAPRPERQPGAPVPARPKPRLRVVPPPRRARSRVPFVLACMALLTGALLVALLLNTAMAQGEYERFQLATRLAQSAQLQQELATRLDEVAAPTALAERAESLGMVPSTSRGYLRLSDGAVLGDPAPAEIP
jgi:hypothetical protein